MGSLLIIYLDKLIITAATGQTVPLFFISQVMHHSDASHAVKPSSYALTQICIPELI